MLPIDFEGANITMGKPNNMTDEQCMSVRAFKGVDADGFPFFLTAWQPSYEDMKALTEGRPVMVKMVGTGFQPIAVYTYDEDFKANV